MLKQTLHVRVIGEDFDEKRATVYSVRFIQKENTRLIRIQNLVKYNSYSALLLGLSVTGFHQWLGLKELKFVNPGSHIYHQVFDFERQEWVSEMPIERLMDLIG